jgi:hypothetical protein
VKSQKVVTEPMARHYLHSWHGFTKPQQGSMMDLQAPLSQEYDASYLHLTTQYNPFTNGAFGGAVIEKDCNCDEDADKDTDEVADKDADEDADSSYDIFGLVIRK